MNPSKIYLVDTGFTLLATEFSENRGRMLENLVSVELARRGRRTFYYKRDYECDFITVEMETPQEAIQVCWDFGPKTKKRELRGLTKAMQDFDIDKGVILTYEQEETVDIKEKKVQVVPVWKWLLE